MKKIFAAVVALLVCTYAFANNSNHASSQGVEQHVIVTAQPLASLTDDILNQDTLEILEDYVKNSGQMPFKKYVRENTPVKTSSFFINSNGQKLALINAETETHEGKVYIKLIAGIKGGEFIRIQCMDKKNISLVNGPCVNKVQEIFNVHLNE